MRHAAVALLFATSLFAADASQPVTVIRAARLIDGRGGSVIAPAVVVVRGNKIESVGGAVPAGAQVIDLGDVTLLPGLIDAHTHTLLQGDITAEDYDKQLFRESLPYRALRATKALKIALDHGFTTIRDVETEGAMYTDVDLKRAVNNGIIAGPRMVVSTRRADGRRCRERPQSGARTGRQRRRLDQGVRRPLLLRGQRRHAVVDSY